MKNIVAKIVTFVAALFCLSAPTTALAWGEYGHLTVCDLAYRNLTDPAKEALKTIFHEKQGGISVKDEDGLEKRHYTSFNVGCLEEDAFPRKHKNDHFINVDRSTKSITSSTCPTGGTCIFAGINRDLGILKDKSKSDEDRVFALMAVGHWIGDIHQPLHISFSDDLGGNAIKLKMKTTCGTSSVEVSNLHALWDKCLLEAGLFERVRQRKDFKKSWKERTITYRAVDSLLVNTTLSEEKTMVGTDPVIWANESYEVTLKAEVQYCVQIGNLCQYDAGRVVLEKDGTQKQVTITSDYLNLFAPVAQDRVKKAGFRLAHLINLALDPAYSQPIQNSTQSP